MSFTALLLAVVFSADTSNPTNSFFRRGEAATVTFAVSGIPSGETFKLESAIYDEHDRKLADMPALDVAGGADGKWTGSLPLPTERYGGERRVGGYSVKATAIAAEGEWLVAYVPAMYGIIRFRAEGEGKK